MTLGECDRWFCCTSSWIKCADLAYLSEVYSIVFRAYF